MAWMRPQCTQVELHKKPHFKGRMHTCSFECYRQVSTDVDGLQALKCVIFLHNCLLCWLHNGVYMYTWQCKGHINLLHLSWNNDIQALFRYNGPNDRHVTVILRSLKTYVQKAIYIIAGSSVQFLGNPACTIYMWSWRIILFTPLAIQPNCHYMPSALILLSYYPGCLMNNGKFPWEVYSLDYWQKLPK